MRIAARVTKLEKTYYPEMQKCPACGDIDFETGEGLFYPGITLESEADDGTHYCLCKWCPRSFQARIIERENGVWWASEVTPAEMPV